MGGGQTPLPTRHLNQAPAATQQVTAPHKPRVFLPAWLPPQVKQAPQGQTPHSVLSSPATAAWPHLRPEQWRVASPCVTSSLTPGGPAPLRLSPSNSPPPTEGRPSTGLPPDCLLEAAPRPPTTTLPSRREHVSLAQPKQVHKKYRLAAF